MWLHLQATMFHAIVNSKLFKATNNNNNSNTPHESKDMRAGCTMEVKKICYQVTCAPYHGEKYRTTVYIKSSKNRIFWAWRPGSHKMGNIEGEWTGNWEPKVRCVMSWFPTWRSALITDYGNKKHTLELRFCRSISSCNFYLLLLSTASLGMPNPWKVNWLYAQRVTKHSLRLQWKDLREPTDNPVEQVRGEEK
jgi:hypothetical protein